MLNKFLSDRQILIRKMLPRPSVLFAKQYFKNKPIKVIEVGTDEGINAESILKHLNVEKMVCIDPYTPYPERKDKGDLLYSKLKAKAKLDKYMPVEFEYIDSLEYSSEDKYDFIYLDGNHSYAQVAQEIVKFYLMLNEGGILAGHDIDHEGVFKAVGHFTLHADIKLNLRYPDWWIIKTK